MRMRRQQWLVLLVTCFLVVLAAGPVRGGWIIVIGDPIPLYGEQLVITKHVWGFADAVINGPGGMMMHDECHDGGVADAQVKVYMDGMLKAAARAHADCGTQKAWSMWAVDETGGWNVWNGNGTKASVMKMVTSQTVLVPTGAILPIFLIKDPNEAIGAFFGPGVQGKLDYNVQLREDTSGMVLLNSHSEISNDSPDNFTDSTGSILWNRSPGLFPGLEDLGEEFQNVSSDNRWDIGDFQHGFQFPVFLNAGEQLNANFFLDVFSTIGTSDGTSSSLFGIGDKDNSLDANPEPSTLVLIGVGCVCLFAYRWRQRRPLV